MLSPSAMMSWQQSDDMGALSGRGRDGVSGVPWSGQLVACSARVCSAMACCAMVCCAMVYCAMVCKFTVITCNHIVIV